MASTVDMKSRHVHTALTFVLCLVLAGCGAATTSHHAAAPANPTGYEKPSVLAEAVWGDQVAKGENPAVTFTCRWTGTNKSGMEDTQDYTCMGGSKTVYVGVNGVRGEFFTELKEEGSNPKPVKPKPKPVHHVVHAAAPAPASTQAAETFHPKPVPRRTETGSPVPAWPGTGHLGTRT